MTVVTTLEELKNVVRRTYCAIDTADCGSIYAGLDSAIRLPNRLGAQLESMCTDLADLAELAKRVRTHEVSRDLLLEELRDIQEKIDKTIKSLRQLSYRVSLRLDELEEGENESPIHVLKQQITTPAQKSSVEYDIVEKFEECMDTLMENYRLLKTNRDDTEFFCVSLTDEIEDIIGTPISQTT